MCVTRPTSSLQPRTQLSSTSQLRRNICFQWVHSYIPENMAPPTVFATHHQFCRGVCLGHVACQVAFGLLNIEIRKYIIIYIITYRRTFDSFQSRLKLHYREWLHLEGLISI